MITLKKYANDRLYDIVNKKYVTKDQLSKLIEKKETIKVVLAKTGKDVTKSVVSSLPTSKKSKKNSKIKPLIQNFYSAPLQDPSRRSCNRGPPGFVDRRRAP